MVLAGGAVVSVRHCSRGRSCRGALMRRASWRSSRETTSTTSEGCSGERGRGKQDEDRVARLNDAAFDVFAVSDYDRTPEG